ncbi:MAG: flippase [Patescibacteria group bacterium]|jgi:O-antigen/teichoic acid export membrane protein
MSETRAIAWNTGSQAVGKVISTLLGVAGIAIMTRHLGLIGFGYYSTANAFFQIFAIMLDLGINVMLVQMLGEHKGDEKYENRAVSATMTLRIATGILVLGIAPFIGLLFPYAWEVKLAIFALWASFFSASLNQVVIGVQQRHLKMHIVAISEVLGRAILLIGLLVAIALNLGLIPIVIFVSIGSACNLIINWWVARHYASFKWNWDTAFWKELLTRSWPIGVSIFFNLAYFKADTLILSLVRPAAEVGIYSAAYRVLEILVTFPFMLAGVMLPLLAHAWAKKNADRFAHLLRQSYNVMILIAIPMAVGIIVMGVPAMIFISGQDYAASGQILKILAIATAVIYFGTISSHVVVAVNKQMKMLPVYIITAILTVIGYVTLIPQYGMVAAAWLTVASETAVAVASTLIALETSPKGFSWSVTLKSLFASLVMALAILPLQNLWLPIPIAVGVIVYAALIVITGAISKETLKEIFAMRRGEATIDVL